MCDLVLSNTSSFVCEFGSYTVRVLLATLCTWLYAPEAVLLMDECSVVCHSIVSVPATRSTPMQHTFYRVS
jgi:hypothetical protein